MLERTAIQNVNNDPLLIVYIHRNTNKPQLSNLV